MHTPDSSMLVQALAARLRADLIETHISWVLLAGETAYKIKKPVRLPFVDYSSLEARHHFCQEELRLNQRLAQSLYLGLSTVTGTPHQPEIDGTGPVLEFAVRMRRFPAGALFSEKVETGTLRPAEVDDLASLLADFHEHAQRAEPATGFGAASTRRDTALAALHGAQPFARRSEWARLREWMDAQAGMLAPLWENRRSNGSIRECHGDLHLDNLIAAPAAVAAFDGIEFDPALRWIDVLDDMAFAVMDFAAHGRRDFAFRFLNGWLDRIGGHEALAALRFSMVYRALVRAQVAGLRNDRARIRRYLDAASGWLAPGAPRLVITHGLPGSGKSFQSQRLLEVEGAIRLRSDVERKRLFGLGMLQDSRAAGFDAYGRDATARTYERLLAGARCVLAAGFTAILDAAYLRRAEREQALMREQARALALGLGVPFFILHCDAPAETLRQRLLTRRGDVSEADVGVLDRLQATAEPLAPEERQYLLDPPWPAAPLDPNQSVSIKAGTD
jgi:uncharacterized protein